MSSEVVAALLGGAIGAIPGIAALVIQWVCVFRSIRALVPA
jgi:hypothetical protein